MTSRRIGLSRGAALLAAAILGIAASTPAVAQREQNVEFVERFRAPLDESFWLIAHGWSNGDWAANDWVRDQVATGPDGLTLTMGRSLGEEKPFSSGEIRTLGRYSRGYFEIDMRVPRGAGIVSGFFTYTGSPFDDPHDEIDIEILGRNTREAMLTVFTDDVQNSETVPLGFDAAEGFHLYAFEWTEDAIRWYIDDKLVREVRDTEFPLPTTPQVYYLDLWGSENLTDWLGFIDPRGAPWTLHVACMAYAERYDGRTLCREP